MSRKVYFWEDETLDLANVKDEDSHWVIGVMEYSLSQYLISILDISQAEKVLPGFLEVGFGFQNQELIHVGHC